MARIEFTKKTKLEAWSRSGGNCEGCTARLYPGRFDYDHVIPTELGGPATLENCAVLCSACHRKKTGQIDIPTIAKSNRVRASHLKLKQPKGRPIPGSKRSGYKRKMDGTVVKR